MPMFYILYIYISQCTFLEEKKAFISIHNIYVYIYINLISRGFSFSVAGNGIGAKGFCGLTDYGSVTHGQAERRPNTCSISPEIPAHV